MDTNFAGQCENVKNFSKDRIFASDSRITTFLHNFKAAFSTFHYAFFVINSTILDGLVKSPKIGSYQSSHIIISIGYDIKI